MGWEVAIMRYRGMGIGDGGGGAGCNYEVSQNLPPSI